jgi:hypothetical protein
MVLTATEKDNVMDRDPQENLVDAEDRTTPTTGQSPFGESGAERARVAKNQDAERDRDDTERRTGELDIAGKRSEPGAVAPTTPLPPD